LFHFIVNGMLLPLGNFSRFLQFISLLIRVNRQLLSGKHALCVRQDDGIFIRANCAILGAIGNDNDFSRRKFAGSKYDAHVISSQIKNEVRSANVARHDQRAFRCGVTRARRGRKWKNAVAFASVSGTAAVVALRLRSSRLSAPLHFSARRTADRSSLLFFTM
jgi:hypothetical protein